MKRKLNVGKFVLLLVLLGAVNVVLRLFVFPDAGTGSSVLSIVTVAAAVAFYYLCSKPVDQDDEE